MTDLITTAKRLARAKPSRPAQADLKRAVSTAYYGAFHVLARQCADLVVGTGASRSDGAWAQVYRALDHGFVKRACMQASTVGFPPGIVAFAAAFPLLQEHRHAADYDPFARFTRAEASSIVSQAETAIASLGSAPVRDRRAFAVYVLLKRRG